MNPPAPREIEEGSLAPALTLFFLTVFLIPLRSAIDLHQQYRDSIGELLRFETSARPPTELDWSVFITNDAPVPLMYAIVAAAGFGLVASMTRLRNLSNPFLALIGAALGLLTLHFDGWVQTVIGTFEPRGAARWALFMASGGITAIMVTVVAGAIPPLAPLWRMAKELVANRIAAAAKPVPDDAVDDDWRPPSGFRFEKLGPASADDPKSKPLSPPGTAHRRVTPAIQASPRSDRPRRGQPPSIALDVKDPRSDVPTPPLPSRSQGQDEAWWAPSTSLTRSPTGEFARSRTPHTGPSKGPAASGAIPFINGKGASPGVRALL